jgi:tetratricopeptide (TPR) repeat protein
MNRTVLSAVVLLLACVQASITRAQTANTPEYRERLVAEKKYPEALQAYKDALAKDPKNPVLLYNAGLMASLCEKPNEAIAFWTQEKTIEPDNWRLRAKLIQAYEAASDAKQRDSEREELFKLHKKAVDGELKKLEYYCRDQFSVGKKRIMVFEHFELQGDHAVRLRFMVLKPDGQDVEAKYSLGSYRTTNDIAREMKEIKPGERLFHLDGYFQGGRSHRTYAFYTNEPKYETVKAAVKEIVEGKRKPTSGTDS